MIFSSARGILANLCTVACTCARAVDHANFKTKKIYSQGILVNYSKICTNENFLLYDTSSYIPGLVTTPLGLHVMEDDHLAAPEGGMSRKTQKQVIHFTE